MIDCSRITTYYNQQFKIEFNAIIDLKPITMKIVISNWKKYNHI